MTTYLSASANSGTTTNSSASVAIPSGAAGQPALLLVQVGGTSVTITPGSGWTLVSGPHIRSTTQQVVVYRKTLTVVDTAAAVSFSAASRWALGLVVAVDGEFGDPTFNIDTSQDTNVPIPASNVADATSDVIAIGGIAYAAGTATGVAPPPGWTELQDSASSHASGLKHGAWVVKRDTTVASGATAAAAAGTIADGNSIVVTFLVKSAAAVSTVVGAGWNFGRGRRGATVVVTPPPPPPPPAVSTLKFGTTLFGQSYARYKSRTISSESARYAAAEADTGYSLGGTLRSGGAVTRVYNDAETGPGTWTAAAPGYLRAGQTVIYSFRFADTTTDATIKANMRTFLASKDPATTPFLWFCHRHEWDNDSSRQPGTAGWTRWFEVNRLIREVMDEVAFAGRTDYRFGFISTGVTWNKGTTALEPKGWRTILNTMATERGDDDTWDFLGGDRYNPAWDGSQFFVPVDEWMLRKDEAYAYSGLPFVVGEGSTARPYSNYTTGYSKAQLETMRENWLRDLMTAVRDRGYFDAFAWWRVPATGGFERPFSTIMGTPTGYDAELAAAGILGPPNGFDSPKMVAVHSEFMVKSIDAANTNYAAGLAPHTISYV